MHTDVQCSAKYTTTDETPWVQQQINWQIRPDINARWNIVWLKYMNEIREFTKSQLVKNKSQGGQLWYDLIYMGK